MRLAEASCTEGCCGALYVTIQRDGDYVLWDEWRNPDEDEIDLPAWPWEPNQVNVFLFGLRPTLRYQERSA